MALLLALQSHSHLAPSLHFQLHILTLTFVLAHPAFPPAWWMAESLASVQGLPCDSWSCLVS